MIFRRQNVFSRLQVESHNLCSAKFMTSEITNFLTRKLFSGTRSRTRFRRKLCRCFPFLSLYPVSAQHNTFHELNFSKSNRIAAYKGRIYAVDASHWGRLWPNRGGSIHCCSSHRRPVAKADASGQEVCLSSSAS